MIQIQCMTAVCIRNLTYSAFENYIKVIKIYGCEKDDGITLTQAFITLFIIFPHPSFFAPKINWIEPSEIEPIFFNKKIICAAICINVKKWCSRLIKKNPHNSTIYAS